MAEHAKDYEEAARAVVGAIWSSFWSEGRGISRALTLAIEEHGEHPEIIRLVRDLGQQTKVPQGMDVGMELIAALWLARQGILAPSPVGDDMTSPIIDLGAEWAGIRWGVEVKSNRDAVQKPLLYSSPSDEVRGLIDIADVYWPMGGKLFAWEGIPPANDLSHEAWSRLKREVSADIEEKKEQVILPGERLVFSWKGRVALQGDEETVQEVACRLEVLGKGAGVVVNLNDWGADPDRAFRRVTRHATRKSKKLSHAGEAVPNAVLMYVACDDHDDVTPARISARWAHIQGAIDPMWKGIVVLRTWAESEGRLRFICHATDYQGEAWGGADALPDPS